LNDDIDRWFPYPEYRPHQREMLEAAAHAVESNDHSVLMVDAPTGSGKTSILSALLAVRGDKRIVVALRTVSQVSIYLDEIQKIKQHTNKRPRVAYLVGKEKTCQLRDELDNVYLGCDVLKIKTRNLLESKLQLYMKLSGRSSDAVYDPSNDSELIKTVMDEGPGERSCCPYYLLSKEAYFIDGDIRFRNSKKAQLTAREVGDKIIYPGELAFHCGDLCPYELMAVSADGADVITLNYNHVFDDTYRDAMYHWLGLEPENTILLIDEAHNLGDSVRAVNSDTITQFIVKKAMNEVESSRSKIKKTGLKKSLAIAEQILPRIYKFMEKMSEKGPSSEEWFDPHMFSDFVFGESLVREDDRMVAELMNLADVIARQKENESSEIYLQHLGDFLFMLNFAKNDEAYVPLKYTEQRKIRNNTYTNTSLEIRNIDPSSQVASIVDMHHTTIMLSGTLSPAEAYELYYFGKNGRATIIKLPNQFPPENRLILAASSATTQSSRRNDPDNVAEIQRNLDAFIKGVPGNVVVYFTSYSLLDQYLDDCTSYAQTAGKRIYLEPRESEQVPAILSQFFQAGMKAGVKPGVLLAVTGGKMSEGIDYRGEALKGAMVVGLPLTAYTEIQKIVNEFYKNKYGNKKGMFIAYTLPAINRALQALGRVHRSAEEDGVLVLCDSRFAHKGGMEVREHLPEWMEREMVVCSGKESTQLIADWVKNHVSIEVPPEMRGLMNGELEKNTTQQTIFQTENQFGEKTKLMKILGKIAKSHERFYLGAINNYLNKEERFDSKQLKNMFSQEDFLVLGLEATYVGPIGDVEVRRIAVNDK
jgi:DNA excision repair protein ERCC-2